MPCEWQGLRDQEVHGEPTEPSHSNYVACTLHPHKLNYVAVLCCLNHRSRFSSTGHLLWIL